MRDEKRIDEILTLFRLEWRKNPDMRFMQMVRYLYKKSRLPAGISEDFYYTEDADFLHYLRSLHPRNDEF